MRKWGAKTKGSKGSQIVWRDRIPLHMISLYCNREQWTSSLLMEAITVINPRKDKIQSKSWLVPFPWRDTREISVTLKAFRRPPFLMKLKAQPKQKSRCILPLSIRSRRILSRLISSLSLIHQITKTLHRLHMRLSRQWDHSQHHWILIDSLLYSALQLQGKVMNLRQQQMYISEVKQSSENDLQ